MTSRAIKILRAISLGLLLALAVYMCGALTALVLCELDYAVACPFAEDLPLPGSIEV
jgi:hypothetical protein